MNYTCFLNQLLIADQGHKEDTKSNVHCYSTEYQMSLCNFISETAITLIKMNQKKDGFLALQKNENILFFKIPPFMEEKIIEEPYKIEPDLKIDNKTVHPDFPLRMAYCSSNWKFVTLHKNFCLPGQLVTMSLFDLTEIEKVRQFFDF